MDNDKIYKDLTNDLHILLAVECIINDFQEYPLFYHPDSVSFLTSEAIKPIIKNKINLYYAPSCGESFSIPYDFLSDRTAITIPIEDLAIRYLVRTLLQKYSKHIMFTPEEHEDTLAEIVDTANAKSLNIFKIDIANFYESIDHNIFIKSISEILNIDINHDFCKFLNSCLKVVYRTIEGDIIRKETGMIIGLKPDEYFADLLMNHIINCIKKSIEQDVFYVADEIIFFSKSLNEARTIFNVIEHKLNDFGLHTNKSKNKSISLSIDELENRKELILEDNLQELLDGSYLGKFILQQQGTSYSYSISKERNSLNTVESEENDSDSKDELSQLKVSSYEDSIRFLKSLSYDKNQFLEYQQNHPNYSKFYNIIFSQPKDFLIDFEKLNFSIFQVYNLNKLLKVIYQYPRSEYYSYIAIDVLIYIATNSIHCVNYYIDKMQNTRYVSGLVSKLTIACDFSNIAIIEILKSDNVHDYQKYLVLRRLFKNKEDLDFSLDNYKIEQVTFHIDNPSNAPYLPYASYVRSLIKTLGNSTNHYALKTLCNHLIKD